MLKSMRTPADCSLVYVLALTVPAITPGSATCSIDGPCSKFVLVLRLVS